MRNNINGADIDASYDILTNNLKKKTALSVWQMSK